MNLRSMFKRKPAAVVSDSAVDILSVAPVSPGIVPETSVTATAAAQKGGHMGMRGYAPHVISHSRARCEGCKEPVKAAERHICVYNAHNHLDTLTDVERAALITQLQRMGVKSTLPELVKRKPRKSR